MEELLNEISFSLVESQGSEFNRGQQTEEAVRIIYFPRNENIYKLICNNLPSKLA